MSAIKMIVTKVDEEEPQAAKTVRTTRRKSSLSAKRRSLINENLPKDSDICETISLAMTEEERLTQCMQMCLGHSLQKIEKELEDEEFDDSNIRKFQTALRDSGMTAIQEMKDSGRLGSIACEREKLVANPKNIVRQERINDAKTYGRSLKKEMKAWDTTVELRKYMAVKAAKTEIEVSESDVDLPADFIEFHKSRPDYHSMQQQLSQKVYGLTNMIKQVVGIADNISGLERTAAEILDRNLQGIEEDDDSGMNASGEESPTELVQKFIDVHATPALPSSSSIRS